MTDQLFRAAVDQLWGSLLRRHSAGNRARYGKCPLEKAEFSAWLLAQSIEGRGLAWRCRLSGNVLTYAAKTLGARLTLDHRVPIADGGASTLGNLQIISQEQNLIKGDLSQERYQSLLWFLDGWPEADRESVLRRLKGYRPNWGSRRK